MARRLERSLDLGGSKSADYRLAGYAKSREPLVGSIVAKRYFLLSQIGKGGMSVVYKAKDLTNQNILAIKTLRYQWAEDGVTVRRFQREAQALSLLKHPAIVGIYDYGETRNQQPFFVMDYLTGESLGDMLKKSGNLQCKRARAIFRQVFDAMQHAHAAGLVHRDLKPGNIMLSKTEQGRDVVKIVDFGIAKLQEEAQKLTRLGEVWGSPVYMSPEQCQGAPLDARSDIYSLGVCLFEALSGQLPFFGKNFFETMMLQINEPPPSIRLMRPDLVFNQELDNVLCKALQKNPDERFQSAGAFKDKLDEAVDKMYASTSSKQAFNVVVRKPASASKQGIQANPRRSYQDMQTERGSTAAPGLPARGKVLSHQGLRAREANAQEAYAPESYANANVPAPHRSESRLIGLIGIVLTVVLALCIAGGAALRDHRDNLSVPEDLVKEIVPQK